MEFELHHAHAWDLKPKDAISLQKELAAHVRVAPLAHPPETIAGVDVSVRGDQVRTAIVVLSFPNLEICDQATWTGQVAYPYVPGLLSFREMPAILPALDGLSVAPDLWMTDSQGRAHPRRMGLACHLGVMLDEPAVGVAKTRFVGSYEPPGPDKGDVVDLLDRDEVIGAVVRTRKQVKPVFVSVGHRVTLNEAVELTLRCTTRYKLPEPTRLAHLLSKNGRLRKGDTGRKAG